MEGGQYTDVVGVIEGNELKDEYIVLGAHFDHLGVKDGKIYPGADDNASGSAALIEIARVLSAHRENLRRSVIIAAFDGEELGLYGSEYLAGFLDSVVGLENIKLMMSIDMVGWYGHNGSLTMEGVATIKNGRRLAVSSAGTYSLNVHAKNFETSMLTATDTDGFARRKIPTLAVTTGLGPHYHQPSDTPDRIDYDGLDRITGYLGDFALTAASDTSFAASGRLARKHLDRAPLFQIGLSAALGAASLRFPSAAVTSFVGMDYSGGVTTRLNFSNYGLQLDALYEQSTSRFPALDEPLGHPQYFSQRSLTVPAYFLLKTGAGENYAFLGLGGYYSHVFSYSFSASDPGWAVSPDQGGLALNFGVKVYGMVLEWTFRRQLGELFPGNELARLGTASYLKLSWLF